MTSSLLSGTVKHSPAAAGGYGVAGRLRPLHGGSTCHFGSKRPVAYPPLRASSPSPTAVRSDRPSPAADLKASPVPMLLVSPYLLDEKKTDTELVEKGGQYLFYSLPEKKIVPVKMNQNSWRRYEMWNDVHWIGASKGWIMYMSRRECNLYLCNPFYPYTSPIIPLPPIETLTYVTARNFRRRRSETDETDRSSGELDFEFILENWHDPEPSETEEEYRARIIERRKRKWFEFPLPFDSPAATPAEDLVNRGYITKFTLSSAPTSNSEDLRSCIVAITYGLGEKLAICRLGDKTWTPIDAHYNEIIFSNYTNSKLIARTWRDGIKLYQFSPKKSESDLSPECNVIPNIVKESWIDDGMVRSHFLVESATDPNHLLMVRSAYKREDNDYYSIEVFKLDLSDPSKKWMQVNQLKDQALFVGHDSESLAVSAAQLPPGVKPNCVYFTDFLTCNLGVSKLNKMAKNIVKKRVKKAKEFEGLHIDYALKEEGWYPDTWEEEFRKEGDGWLLWVAPNPW